MDTRTPTTVVKEEQAVTLDRFMDLVLIEWAAKAQTPSPALTEGHVGIRVAWSDGSRFLSLPMHSLVLLGRRS